MRVGVACDHGGFPLKEIVVDTVCKEGHTPLDFGTHNTECVDYPDFAEKVGHALQSGNAERGIIICGSGVGACIAANKMRGIMGGVCHDTYLGHPAAEKDKKKLPCFGG